MQEVDKRSAASSRATFAGMTVLYSKAKTVARRLMLLLPLWRLHLVPVLHFCVYSRLPARTRELASKAMATLRLRSATIIHSCGRPKGDRPYRL